MNLETQANKKPSSELKYR